MKAPASARALLALSVLGLVLVRAAATAGEAKRRPSPAQVFKWLDKNGDGILTEEEYVKHSRFRNKEQARRIFRAADTDGDGKITKKRYVEHRRITDKAKEIFTKLDGDGDGRITEREFLAKAAAIFRALDRDGDGAVTIPEYLRARSEWADMRGASVDDALERLDKESQDPKAEK